MLKPLANGLHILGVCWALFVMVLKRRLQYRGDLLVQSCDELLRGVVGLVMLQVYVARTQEVGGWSSAELLFIFGFAMVPLSLFHCFCGNIYQLSGHYLIQGNFDRVLLRPMSSFLQICSDRISIEDLSGCLLGAAVMIYAMHSGAIDEISLLGLLAFCGLILSSFLIVVSVFMLFAALSFWFEDRVGMVPPVYNLMEFGRWPVGIFHWGVQALITFLIPFSFTAFYPASLFVSGPESATPATHIAWATPLVAVLALTIAVTVWRQGVKRYHSTGN